LEAISPTGKEALERAPAGSLQEYDGALGSLARKAMTARRAVLRGLGAMALIAAGRSRAQQPAKPAHVGILWPAVRNDPLPQKFSAAFHQRLRELGHVEGKPYVTDARFTDGAASPLPQSGPSVGNAACCITR
jgi:hypothetical protein